MRHVAVVAIVAMLLASSPASAVLGRELSMFIIAVRDDANLVVWEPAADAQAYELYRGDSLAHASKIAETVLPYYLDESPPKGDTWYIVRAIQSHQHNGEDSPTGSCVDRQGTTGVSVTTSECV